MPIRRNAAETACRTVPGIADLRIQQEFDHPELRVDVDRSLASEVGLTERDVANSLLVTLAGSNQVAPTFWLNPKNGVSYPIVTQTPQYRIDTLFRSATTSRSLRGGVVAACWARWPISRAGPATAWSRTTTCSR